MIRKTPTKNTYKLPYPEGLVAQIVAFHKQMSYFDVSLPDLNEKKMKDLDNVIGTLRPDEQLVIQKHYIDHMSKKEIVEVCGINYDQVCYAHQSWVMNLVRKMCLP